METKRVRSKVVMLHTEDETGIYDFMGDLIYNPKGECLHSRNNQHLYFTTDEGVKKGNWCYDLETPRVYVAQWDSPHNSKKVIGSTDPKLNKGVRTACKTCKARGQIKIGVNCDKCYGSGINFKESVPQPSQAFIEKYVKLGGIDEVDVEYNYYEHICGIKGFDETLGDNCNGCKYNNPQLKVDSRSTMTIHSIKNSWNKKEILAAVSAAQPTLTGVGLSKIIAELDKV